MRRLFTVQLTLMLALGCSSPLLRQARQGLQKPTPMGQTVALPGPYLWSSAGHRLVPQNSTADGTRLLLHSGGRIYLWNTAQARMEQVIPVHDRWVSSASISSDGMWILLRETTTVQPDKTAIQGFSLLETGTGQVRWQRRFVLKESASYLHLVNFSVDEKEVMAVAINVKKKEARLLAWSLSDGTLTREDSFGLEESQWAGYLSKLDHSSSQAKGPDNLGGDGLYSHLVLGGTGEGGVAVWLTQGLGWMEKDGELPRGFDLPKEEDWRFAGTVGSGKPWPSVLVWTPSKTLLVDPESPAPPNDPWQTTRIIRDVAVISNQQMALVEEGTNAVAYRIRSLRPSAHTPDSVVILPEVDSLHSASITPLEHGKVRVVGTQDGTIHQWTFANSDTPPEHTSLEIPGFPLSIQPNAPSESLALFRGSHVIHLDFAEGKRVIHHYTPPPGRLVQRALALWGGRLAVELVGFGRNGLWLFLRWNGSSYDIDGKMRIHNSRGVRFRPSLASIEIFEDSGICHTIEWRDVPRRVATTYHQLHGTTVVRASFPGQVMLPFDKTWRESALRAAKEHMLGWGLIDGTSHLAPIELEEGGQKSQPKLPNKPNTTSD